MKTLIVGALTLAFSVIYAGEMKQKGYEIQWANEMRLCGTHPDTIKMFLDAPMGLPANDTTGLPVLGSTSKVISSDGTRGWLWIVEQTANVRRNDPPRPIKDYWSYAIRPILVFDTEAGMKK